MTRSPFTVTVLAGSGLVAGPRLTAPVAMSNLLPWQLQSIVPSADLRHRAAHVRADGGEGLELPRLRLGDDRLGGRDDRAATDRDVGLGDCPRRVAGATGRRRRGRAAGGSSAAVDGAPAWSRRRRRRAPSRRRRRHRPLPHRGSRYGGRGVLRSASWSTSGMARSSGVRTGSAPRSWKGERTPRPGGSPWAAARPRVRTERTAAPPGRRLCECGAAGWAGGRRAGSRGMDRAGVRRVHGGTAGSRWPAGPTSWGWSRWGPWPAGTTSRTSSPTTTSSSSSSPPPPSRCGEDLSWLPRADAGAAVLPRDGARPEGASTTTATCWSWPSSPRTSSPCRGSTATASCSTGLT